MSRTLLLVTPTFIARGDLDSRGRLRAVAHAVPNPAMADAASLTLAALALSKEAARRVWVLTTRAATAVVEIPAGRLQGLEGAEASSALAFEAEALTGLSALSAQTAAVRLPPARTGDESWWITQMETRLRGEIEGEIVRRGARLEGISHPGGLLRPPAQGAEIIELWQDLVFLRRSGTMDILPVDETAPLNALLQRFPPAADTSSRVLLTLRRDAGSPDVQCLSLQDEDTLRAWMQECWENLDAPTSAVPVLMAPVRPMSTLQRFWISAAAAVLVLVLCAAHAWFTERRLQATQAEIASLSAVAKQRDELKTTGAEISRLRTELDTARRRQSQALRGFGTLLAAVAELRPQGLMVLSIKEPGTGAGGGGGGSRHAGIEATICGLCLRQELAAEFSKVLGARLQSSGWSVRPARTSARLVEGATAWDFDIPLRLDGGTTTPATASATQP